MRNLIIAGILLSTSAMAAGIPRAPSEPKFTHPPTKKSHNRMRILAGIGNTHFKKITIGRVEQVILQQGFVYGLGYDIPLNNTFSIGAELTSNGNALLSVGIEL